MKQLTIRMTGDVAEVLLYDVIGEDFFGGVSAKVFREQVKAIKAGILNLRINSPGGSVFEGSAMLQALDDFPGRVEVDVDGVAASAASFVAMGGDVVRVASNGMMMIHNPISGVIGDAGMMRREAELLDKVKEQIIEAYRRRTPMTKKQLADAMDLETWYTGKEAVDAGLADSVTQPAKVAAFAGFGDFATRFRYRHAPKCQPAGDAASWEETARRQRIAASL